MILTKATVKNNKNCTVVVEAVTWDVLLVLFPSYSTMRKSWSTAHAQFGHVLVPFQKNGKGSLDDR